MSINRIQRLFYFCATADCWWLRSANTNNSNNAANVNSDGNTNNNNVYNDNNCGVAPDCFL